MVAYMPADRRADFFNQLPAASQELLLPALAHAERENILKDVFGDLGNGAAVGINLKGFMVNINKIKHFNLIGDGFDENLFFCGKTFFGKNADDHNHRIIVVGCNNTVSFNRAVGNDGFIADPFAYKIHICPGFKMLFHRS
ncbi:MAG: hypothetical protein P8185_18605 [Deltaproteobacteria bacterium]